MDFAGVIMKPYLRKINYYETDKMGVTHHSNYIRFMEEARVDFLSQIGWGFDRLESEGLVSPVISISCDYKSPSTFADELEIAIKIEKCSGLKMIIGYEMTNAKTGKLVCQGTSTHAFFDKNGRPVFIEKSYPEFFAALTAADTE